MNIRINKLLKLIPITGLGIYIAFSMASCKRNNPDSSGVEYMPDMYRSPSYEDNSFNPLFADSMTDRVPVKGTVPVGFTPDPFPNTPEGWTNAAQYWKDPFPATPEIVAQGKAVFDIYCVHCHGATGMGDGKVAAKLPGPPPPYSGPALRNITEGEMYQTLEYGKGLMGSHAGQLTVEQRCKVIRYVQTLQKLGQTSATDTVKTATAAPKDSVKKG
ncbi:MAG TPA: cytochrome c [Bacteroidia bacterium]|jgi:mono/diheme cytochrome c family protein|nr:cytochrome c [Bacteroidia bacterium]